MVMYLQTQQCIVSQVKDRATSVHPLLNELSTYSQVDLLVVNALVMLLYFRLENFLDQNIESY